MSETMRMLTFNLRLDTPQDGPYRWCHRRDAIGDFLTRLRPALAGLQEVLPNMWEDFLIRLPKTFRLFGEPRQDYDEAVPILYDTEQITFLEGGVFWLSSTPHIKASKDADAGCIRITTWARFASVKQPSLTMRVYNTHLDHLSEAARIRGLKVTLSMIEAHHINHQEPLVLMGDFNALPNSRVFEPLKSFNREMDSNWRLLDVQADASKGHYPTFHRFSGQATEAIDHLFVSRSVGVKAVDVHLEQQRSHPLSDHHPLSVLLDFSGCQ